MSFLSTLGTAFGGFLSGGGGSALSLIGAGMEVYGQYRAGEDAYDMAQYNKEVEAFNTEQQLRIHRERAKRLVATQRATSAASGVRSGGGSPLMARLEAIEQAAVDEYYIARGGEMRGAARVYEGKVTRNTNRIGAVGSAFGAAADVAKVYGR